MAWQLMIDETPPVAYRGPAEVCTWEFAVGPEQLPGMGFLADRIIDAHVQELLRNGGLLLRLRVWVDSAPTWQTRYRVEVTSKASPLWWNAIILGVLALLSLATTAYVITQLVHIEWGGGLGEAVKWGSIGIGIAGAALLGTALVRRRNTSKGG